MPRHPFALPAITAALAACSPPPASPTVIVVPSPAVEPTSDARPGPRPAIDLSPHPIGEAGLVRGVVHFTGSAPVMHVPRRRRDARGCNTKGIEHNAVIVSRGRLQDTLVRIEAGGVPGEWYAPGNPARVDYVDCVIEPRVQGAMTKQQFYAINGDGTLHDLHLHLGTESWHNWPIVGLSETRDMELPEPTILSVTDDIHPWEHAFVVVSDHPFFAVSDAAGAFTIPSVPPGKYQLEAWHSRYGLKRARIEITQGHGVEVAFQYDGSEPQPPENHEGPGRSD